MDHKNNQPFIYKRDNQLTFRIIFSFAALTILYLVFLSVLYYFGVGFLPLMMMAGIMILAQWYFSDRIVLWSSGAKLVSKEQYPQLHEMVEMLSKRGNLPKPKVAVMNTNIPNAFATGKSHNSSLVAVTTGLMRILDKEELEGVVAHELAHIKNRDVTVLTLASLFSTVAWYLAQYSFFGSMYGGRGYGGSRGNSSGGIFIILLIAIVTWIVSFIIIRAISRYREFSADRGGAQLTGKPMKLAQALLKISGSMKEVNQKDLRSVQSLNAFFIIPAISGKSISKLFSTHPPIEKRIERLQEMERSL